MSLLVLGLVLFLGIHSVAVVGQRERAVAAFGEARWKGLYSVLSAIGLVAIVWGYGLARQAPTVVWIPPTATRHLALLVMLPVFPLLLAAYLPGRIRSAAKHPMLVGTKLWATAHLLANGMLADVLLFGGFLAWAVAVRISLKRRVPRAIPVLPARWANDGIAVVGGLLLYVGIVGWVHVWLFGVSPR